jgi:hypothetical protein
VSKPGQPGPASAVTSSTRPSTPDSTTVFTLAPIQGTSACGWQSSSVGSRRNWLRRAYGNPRLAAGQGFICPSIRFVVSSEQWADGEASCIDNSWGVR